MSNPTYYSQNGEDCLLHALFADQTDGFFVEVGCIDGRRFSNTLAFEERGWHGICIEAHGDYIELLRANRPGSTVIHCAVGASDRDEVPFYANNRGSLSTLDSTKEEEFRRRYSRFFNGFNVQRVAMRRLDTLFRQCGVTRLDLLSIDTEGTEAEVLRGLDLPRWRPRVLVIEADTPRDEELLDAILLPAGYHKSVRFAGNLFYLLEAGMVESVRRFTFSGTLRHTRHPLDEGGDREVAFTYPTPATAPEGGKP